MNTATVTVTKPDAYTAVAVEMIDTKGRRHLVAKVADLAGDLNWCSRKFIATRGTYSGQWLQVDITGWTLASMA
jgi:hypothetical protein